MAKKLCDESDIYQDAFVYLPGRHYIFIDEVRLHRVRYTPYHNNVVFPVKECNISTLISYINKQFGGCFS